MVSNTLDQIVKNFILKRRYTNHWYIEFLIYARDCLREISLDDIQIFNTKIIPVDQDTNAADLPNDYSDWVKVGIKVGQNIRPLTYTNKINPLVSRDANFNPQKYSQQNVSPNDQVYYGYLYPFYWHMSSWNEYGEPIGRYFGWGAGVEDDTFSVFPERNQIQLTENMCVDNIVLEYISDGMNADAATQITPYAYDTITNYIYWQHCENNRTYNMGDKERAKQMYIDSRKILRARVSQFDIDGLRRVVQKNSRASVK